MENYDFVNEKGSWKLTHHVSSVQMTLFFFVYPSLLLKSYIWSSSVDKKIRAERIIDDL